MADNSGKTVRVHYTGTLDDGTKFDSSYDHGEPLEFVCMKGMMIRGFDSAVASMEVNETRTVRIEAAAAYGEYRPEMLQTMPIEAMPGSEQLSVGDKVALTNRMGQQMPAKVVDKDQKTITFDLNHELAGQPLNFEITLLEVR